MLIGETKIETRLKAPFEDFFVDTRVEEFDIDAAWHYLSTEAYWCRYRTREFFETQVKSAFMMVGLFHMAHGKKTMIGMARVTGDGDTNMLNDVYVLKQYQGTGLGVKFLQLLFDAGGRDIWRWLLFTGDRKDWYIKKFGFVVMGTALRSKMAHIPLYMLERDGRALKYLEEEARKTQTGS